MTSETCEESGGDWFDSKDIWFGIQNRLDWESVEVDLPDHDVLPDLPTVMSRNRFRAALPWVLFILLCGIITSAVLYVPMLGAQAPVDEKKASRASKSALKASPLADSKTDSQA